MELVVHILYERPLPAPEGPQCSPPNNSSHDNVDSGDLRGREPDLHERLVHVLELLHVVPRRHLLGQLLGELSAEFSGGFFGGCL